MPYTVLIDISQHQGIILLDCAIHLCITHTNNLALDHFDWFGDLNTHHIVFGVNTSNRQSGPASKPDRTPTIQTSKPAIDGMQDVAPLTCANTDMCASSAIRNTKQ